MMFFKRANQVISRESRILNDNFVFGKDETLLPKFTNIFGKSYAVNVYYLRIQKVELNLT